MYEDIKEQFKSVIRFSQGIEHPKVNSLFRKWEKNKSFFIDLFGGPIYEYPELVEFTLDETQKRNKAMEFAQEVSDIFNNPYLAEFIDENLDTFYENKVSKTLNEDIPQGMKLLKAFKFFEPNKSTLRQIQDMASQIIQENKIKGKLCFSVHPLDFLSSSENDYNWRSCHSLDGEYRVGNLSYMTDSTTFMVYLKAPEDKTLKAFGPVPWNSKKWRMLIHRSSDGGIMFAGRQYPFHLTKAMDFALDIYDNMTCEKSSSFFLPKQHYSRWNCSYVDCYEDSEGHKTYLFNKYLIYGRELVELEKVVSQSVGALNYNDILFSSCYKYPYYTIKKFKSIEKLIDDPIIIGEEVKCLQCGENYISNPETMRCDNCELTYGSELNDVYGLCDCCGRRIYMDDALMIEGGNSYVCDDCFGKYTFTCDICGETYYKEEKTYIPEEYNEFGEWCCRRCYNENIGG